MSVYSYIDIDKVDVQLQNEIIEVGDTNRAEQRYIISVQNGAFNADKTSLPQNTSRILVYEYDAGSSKYSYLLDQTSLLMCAALAKTYRDSLVNPYDKFNYIPVRAITKDYSGTTVGYPIFQNYLSVLGASLSSALSAIDGYGTTFTCTSYSLAWSEGALILTLIYDGGVYFTQDRFVKHSIHTQRYPSVWGWGSDGTAAPNIVTYNGDQQLGEIPDAYFPEWEWEVSLINQVPPSYYSAYIGTVNDAPVSALVPSPEDIGNTCPAQYRYGVLIDNYTYEFLPGAAYDTTMNYFAPMFRHNFHLVGSLTWLDSDSGFVRPVFYVDETTGMPPADVDFETNNGVITRLIAPPCNWSDLFPSASA